MYLGKSRSYFGLKQYDQAIDWARRAIALGTSNPFPHANLAAALALTGHERKPVKRCSITLRCRPASRLRTIAALKATAQSDGDPRLLESFERYYEGLRKAGMPEGEAKTN